MPIPEGHKANRRDVEVEKRRIYNRLLRDPNKKNIVQSIISNWWESLRQIDLQIIKEKFKNKLNGTKTTTSIPKKKTRKTKKKVIKLLFLNT